MKRPSFQFYPGDWQANSNLRRCTRAEKSVWLDVLCLMHDQEEYGVLRWTLKEIAEAAHCKISELKSLREKGVLKGADKGQNCDAYVYVPRSGRRDGAPVTLIPEQDGPIWYSSRFVRDEYVRKIRGESSRYSEAKGDDSGDGSGGDGDASEPSPKGGIGAGIDTAPKPGQSDGSSSSASSSPSVNTQTIVELTLDGGSSGDRSLTEAEKIEGIFAYWQRVTGASKARLGEKRVKTIRAALRWGYSPRDLCRAIQGCALTPHNQGVNDRGQKYLGLHICLGSEDQIDRFMANSKAPPVAPEKKVSGEIPGWWNSPDLALEQAKRVGVGPAHYGESTPTWHGRIRTAIENGGKPPAAIAVPAAIPSVPEQAKVEATPEQTAARRAALLAVAPGLKFGKSKDAEQENQKPVA